MKKLICSLLLLCLTLLPALAEDSVSPPFDPAHYEGKLAIWFFSLPGEDHTGESILIRMPDGQSMLIDGGIVEVGNQINAYLSQLGVNTLDVIVASHMHIDHIGGLPAVMAQHPVKQLYTSPFTAYATSPVAALRSAAAAHGLAFTPLLAGDTFHLGDALFEVLYPFETPVPKNENAITGDFLNDSSLVLRMTYGDIRVLFTGDATRMAEIQMLDVYGDDLQATLIKVPHHGSTDASSRKFVQAVQPQESVMCIYAFNDLNIYDRYKKVGNRPWVTSLDGTVLCVTDGATLQFYTEKERQGKMK